MKTDKQAFSAFGFAVSQKIAHLFHPRKKIRCQSIQFTIPQHTGRAAVIL
jgi:hypothetical protein